MLRNAPLMLSAFCLVGALPGAAGAEGPDSGSQPDLVRDSVPLPSNGTGGQSYGDRNRGGPYGFYSYPRHRNVAGGGSALDRRPSSGLGAGTSPYWDGYHGSAYYGRDYGAPYFGGGYYDGGVYYRERRD